MKTVYYPHSLRDSVHGNIRLTSEEFAIINHPLFFRLHHIRQNSLLYLIFPCASHTRFEHSLGVVHIVDMIYESLLRNSQRAVEKGAISTQEDSLDNTGKAVLFHKLDQKIIDDLLRIARIAALVHDIGHGPFSHTFDKFAPLSKHIAKIIRDDPKLKQMIRVADLLDASTKLKIEHEQMSCVLFAIIWGEILDSATKKDGNYFTHDELPLIVASVILGQPNLCDNNTLVEYMPLLHDLVASAPIDADRMDYMERDSRSIGVSYGLYDKERLLKSFLVYREPNNDSTNKTQTAYRLGIKLSGVRAVENFVQARFELFVQIYYHKTNRAIELMFKEIGKVASNEETDIFNINNTQDLVDAYSDLSDVRFLRLLQNKDQVYKLDTFPDKKLITELADKLAKRELWKRVFESDQDSLSYIYNKLCEGENSEILFDRIDPKATKDLDKGAALLKRGQDGYYSINGDSSEGWTSQSKMIKALEEEEKTIGRIYYKGSDSAQLKKLRDQARQVSLPEKQNS